MSDIQPQFASKSPKANGNPNRIVHKNLLTAKRILGCPLPPRMLSHLKALSRDYGFSVEIGDLPKSSMGSGTSLTPACFGLPGARDAKVFMSKQSIRCAIPLPIVSFSKPPFIPRKGSAGFVGYGDADPSNVSALVRGAEMRIAETRASSWSATKSMREPYEG